MDKGLVKMSAGISEEGIQVIVKEPSETWEQRMLRMRRNGSRGGKSNCSLIIRKYRERMGNRKVKKSQENMKP